ncbi:hypothetical protein LSUB1_G003251 [Lachnellula subtilissima]|uniref:BTB domain-containing protein n=1 Tax=Lachnellula subtilissima TaxID=602034 RepID=A0A8H8RXA0_9HELO|nr:hypothetical protein LSUB1_G003251 [Lachnellula subtilissima]
MGSVHVPTSFIADMKKSPESNGSVPAPQTQPVMFQFRCTPPHVDAGQTFISGDGTLKRGRILVSMKVTKQILISNSKSFATMFRARETEKMSFSVAKQAVIDFEDDDNAICIEIWLRAIHPNAMVDSMYDMDIKHVWNTLQASRRFDFQLEKLNNWFAEWIVRKGGDDCSRFKTSELAQIFYPCQEFDEPKNFAQVTRRLAYEVAGHISDDNPTRYDLRLHPRILANIHKKLYIIRLFLSSGCSCKERRLFAYELALDKTGAWPLEQVLHGKLHLSSNDSFRVAPAHRSKMLPNNKKTIESSHYSQPFDLKKQLVLV